MDLQFIRFAAPCSMQVCMVFKSSSRRFHAPTELALTEPEMQEGSQEPNLRLRSVASNKRCDDLLLFSPRGAGLGRGALGDYRRKMASSKWAIYSLVLTFVLAAAEPPRANVVPGPAPRIQNPSVKIDILSDSGVADELRAEEFPSKMPVTPEAAIPEPLLSLRTRSPAPADILDLLDPTGMLASEEATSKRAGRHLQYEYPPPSPGGAGNPYGDTGVPQYEEGFPMASPGPGGDDYGGDDYGGDDYKGDAGMPGLTCDACCPVGVCVTDDDLTSKPACTDCADCQNGGIPCPDKGSPPQGFKAPRVNGVHFLASNPSKAVIITFDKPTNEGGDQCGGYCPCSVLLDDKTVKDLQASPALAPLPAPPTPRPQSCLLPAVARGGGSVRA